MAARWANVAPWELAAAHPGWRRMIEDSARAEAMIRSELERGR